MGMKKSYRKIAMVSAVALVVGCAGSALAAVDLDNPTALSYAEEITIATSIDLVDDVGGVQDMTFVMNANIIPANTNIHVTVTLSNGATFATAPSATGIADIDDEPTSQPFVVFKGGLDSSTVTFSGNSGAGFGAAENFVVQITAINVLNHADVTADVTVSTADDFGPTTIKTISAAPYLGFDPALVMTVVPEDSAGDYDLIDVAQSTTFFDDSIGDLTTVLGTVGLLHTPRLTATASAATTDADDLISNLAVTYTATNGLSAFDQTGGSVADTVGTFVIDGITATDTTAIASTYSAETDVTFTVPALNEVAISNSPVSVTFTGTALTGYDADSSTGTVSLTPLAKNSQTAIANFALTPGGLYSNYVRISNTSAIEGVVYITVYQDDGTASSSFTLSDVDASYSDALPAQGSSAQMTIQEIYDASGLSAGYTGKLRVEATGEFTDIDIQVYTVSLDGNNFSTF